MIAPGRVPSWAVSRIRAASAMTTAPKSDPDSRPCASDSATGAERERQPPRGELRLVSARRDDPQASVSGAAACVLAGDEEVSGASGPGGRLRLAPAVQLELLSGREGPPPEVVWASLPEAAREAVLVLLARLIDAGAVDERESGR